MATENQAAAVADVVITSDSPQDSQLEFKNIRIPNMSAGNFLGLKFDAPMALAHAWTNFADQVQVKCQPSKEPQAGAAYYIETWIPSLTRALEPADSITFQFPSDIGSDTEPFKKSLEIGLGKIPSKPVVTTGTVVIHCPDPGDDQFNFGPLVVKVTPTFHIPISLDLTEYDMGRRYVYHLIIKEPEQSFRMPITSTFEVHAKGYTYNGTSYIVKSPTVSEAPGENKPRDPLILEVVPAESQRSNP